MNIVTKRLLPVITAIAVTMVMCFGSIAATQTVHAAETTKEKPAVVITGTSLMGGSDYTEANIGKEKVYTLDELKAMAKADPTSGANNQYLYSAINTYATKTIYKAEGVRLDTLLKAAGITDLNADKFVFTAEDGYKVTFDPAATGQEAKNITTALGNTRYYFPGIGTGSEDGKIAVPNIISWAEGGKKGELTEPTEVEPHKKGNQVCLTAGQLNITDQNEPLWNESSSMIIAAGEKMAPVLNVNGKDYTRAELLAKESMTRAYTYTNKSGERTDYVKGVLAADLLSVCEDNDTITLDCADNYQTVKVTKKELKDKNYILAYESGNTAADMEAIFESSKDDASITGCLTLYADGEKPVKLINKISFESAEPAPPQVTAPKAPASLTVKAKSYDSAAVSWAKSADADGYTVYRADAKAKTFKAVKTVAAKTAAWTDTKLKTGTKYTYKVRAYKNDGQDKLYSTYTAAKSVTPQLAKPVLSKAKAGKKSVTLTWKKVAGANGYKVYRADKKNGKYKAVKTVSKASAVSYADKKLKTGKTYYYKIKAYRTVDKQAKYSSYSAVKSAKVK